MSTFIDIIKEGLARCGGSIGIGSSRMSKIVLIQALAKLRMQCHLNFETPEDLKKIYPPAVGRLFEGSESPLSGIRQEEREQDFDEVFISGSNQINNTSSNFAVRNAPPTSPEPISKS